MYWVFIGLYWLSNVLNVPFVALKSWTPYKWSREWVILLNHESTNTFMIKCLLHFVMCVHFDGRDWHSYHISVLVYVDGRRSKVVNANIYRIFLKLHHFWQTSSIMLLTRWGKLHFTNIFVSACFKRFLKINKIFFVEL